MANISEYKKYHKPLSEDKTSYHQGVYIPQNISKVIGGNIIYRSGWEYKLCRWCDLSPNVVRWGCECVSVEYRDRGGVNLDECRKYGLNPNDPAQWPIKNYYIDFYIEFGGKDWNGNPEDVKVYLVEVKPFKETQMPERVADTAKLKDKKRFNKEAQKFLQNTSKWEAARAFAAAKGVNFEIWTERTFKKLGIM